MRVAVIGHHGQLAECLGERAGRNWIFLGRDALDLTRPAGFDEVLGRHAPEIVINAAAYTQVDRAESERDLAFAVNEAAPAALAHWCASNQAGFVHVSTDYVFDGTGDQPWREQDRPHPLNVYGASKLAGEQAVLASGARALVLRTSWVHSPHGSNFVKTMLRLAVDRDRLSIVADQRGAPTSAQDLADAIAALLPLLHAGRIGGLYHCAGAGRTNWADFARAVFEGAKERGLIERSPEITRLATADYPSAARRPLNSMLSSEKLLEDSGVALSGWRLGLQRTLDGLVGVKNRAGEKKS